MYNLVRAKGLGTTYRGTWEQKSGDHTQGEFWPYMPEMPLSMPVIVGRGCSVKIEIAVAVV